MIDLTISELNRELLRSSCSRLIFFLSLSGFTALSTLALMVS